MNSTPTDALYQSCYCEENVYKLLDRIEQNRQDFYAVFISNHEKMIPLWSQEAARNPGGFVMWDYHVIAISKKVGGASQVYDLDSTLEWGCAFSKYWEETMKCQLMELYDEKYRRKFRLIPADAYRTLLSSDRSHMLGPNGNWLKPPPEWPIINPESPSNLLKIINFQEIFEHTVVMNEQECFEFFS